MLDHLMITTFIVAALGALGTIVSIDSSQASQPKKSPNPLVEPWTGPYGGVPPWDKASPELFPEAFEIALAQQRAEIDAIAADTAAPTFENTIGAMQRSGETLDRVSRLFAVLRQNISTPQIQAIDREWQPKLAAAEDAITFNKGLFKRIEAVHNSLASANLTPEQKRLTERTYEDFVRRGARLDDAEKARLSEINQQLATLFSDFRTKVLAEENTWTVLHTEKDLAGLPESLVSAAKAAAEERRLPGKWVILNTRSSVDPFLTFSTRRDLREQVWKKFKSRGDNRNEHDTKGTITRIVKLRADRAKLLGYESHAHWRMADTMAQDPKAAQALMMKVWRPAVSRVQEEVADMEAVARKEAAGAVRIEPWDYLYYAEKVRKAKYDLDQAQLKPYFELNNMVAAALWSAERRYDIRFTELTGKVPVFHPEVRVFEVTDTPSGRHRGLFYLDNFARAGKRSGAWASSYRTQHKLGDGATAISSNNNNFVKGAAGEPVLISLDDATTLFHEFGHALHGLLQDITYPGLSITPRDFVEYPSQVNEQWLLTREVLDKYARHFKTGEPMPQALVDKVEKSEKFNQGYETVEYLAAAILDMELHVRPDGAVDPAAFEREQLAKIGMPREIALRHRLPHFDHLFGSDSYSAGYYSYLWSDVMAADTWQAFVEAGGPWDKQVADRLRKYILSNGNTTDRAEAYRLFRGRDPEVKALLEKRGFPTD
ncbi:MAG TPA: M3 family metallopeptidase [Vicinamibacterales bacterium]|nr:M3 family metallopeptidase [Vicinamibacterales bacterium]